LNKRDEHLEKNISRLIKLMRDSEKPGEGFTESLTESAVAKLGSKDGSKLIWRTIRNGLLSLGAAAVFLAAVGLFISWRISSKSRIEVVSEALKPPCQMISVLELNLAYSRGGMEAVDEQFDKAYTRRGAGENSTSMNDLLNTL
jgi:hypothetical protein